MPLCPPVAVHSAAVPVHSPAGSGAGEVSPSASSLPSGRTAWARNAGTRVTRLSVDGTASPARRIRSAASMNHW